MGRLTRKREGGMRTALATAAPPPKTTLGSAGKSKSAITPLLHCCFGLYRDLVCVLLRRKLHHRVGHPAIVIISLALARKHEQKIPLCSVGACHGYINSCLILLHHHSPYFAGLRF